DVSVGPEVRAAVFMTGGGSVEHGPPFVWLDTSRILYASDQAFGHIHGYVERRMRLATLNVKTGKATPWVETPRFRRSIGTPYLEVPRGGAPRIGLGELGAFRI